MSSSRSHSSKSKREVAVAPEKEVIEKKVEEVAEVEEKEKVTENGTKNGNGTKEAKENGTTKEDAEEVESSENGTSDSTEAPVAAKRKSTGGEESVPAEGVTPEKKAKLVEAEEEPNGAVKEPNGAGEAEATA